MENDLELGKKLRDPQSSGRTEKVVSTQASPSLKLRDRFKSERPSLSYADFHHEIIKNADSIPPEFSEYKQKLQIGRKTAEDDELVRYMSNLPSYLEKGENLREKALNVGVLDWGRLEKWQQNLKQMPCRSSEYSASSSNASSFFSTDESSAHSSRGHSRSPAHQRTHRPTLQYHLKASPLEGRPEGVKSIGGNGGNFQHLKIAQAETLKEQQKCSKEDKPFRKVQSAAKLNESMKKDSDPKITTEIGGSIVLENYEVAYCSDVKMKKFAKQAEKSEKLKPDIVGQDFPDRKNTVVLLVPGDNLQALSSGVSQISCSTTTTSQRSKEAGIRNSTERASSEQVHCGEFHSGISRSCLLPEVENSKHAPIKQRSSMDAQSSKMSFDSTATLPRSVRMFSSPSKSRKGEEKSTQSSTDSTVITPFPVSDMKPSKVGASKVRSSSPTRLFSIGMSKISRAFNSKEVSDVHKFSSENITAKPAKERIVPSACLDKSSSDKQNATSRARSSPLRRLLDPLLKPKTADCRQSTETLSKDPLSTDNTCKSSDGNLESSALHSVKLKLDLTGCKSVSIKNAYQVGKDNSTVVQALLQVAIRNGLPLFTFAVDNNSGILAATMRRLDTPTKNEYSCLYTFFKIREIKKKSWINQGGKGKGKGHDYVPKVVAQMKVSKSQFSNFPSHNSTGQVGIRQSVLFAVDLIDENQQNSDFKRKDELAAIVVNTPKVTTSSLIGDEQQRDDLCKLSERGSEECLPEVRCYSNSGINSQNQTFGGNQDPCSTTVILPGDVHSVPSKGEFSSLVERWISGGLCDCGGWDLGCKLRVLGNQNQPNKKLSSSETCSRPDPFELFDKEGDQENRPFFSLTPFKDRVYSAEFKSSLSHIQAFAICVAVWDSRQLSTLSNSRNTVEEKTSEETISTDNHGIKAPNEMQAEVSTRYVSYPPHSPVGRV